MVSTALAFMPEITGALTTARLSATRIRSDFMKLPPVAGLSAAHGRNFRLVLLASVLGLFSIAVTAQKAPPKDPLCEIQTTERVVAVGDVHGAFDRFVAILQEAKL